MPLTSNLRWAEAPGNALLRARATGLPKDSVANASQIIAVVGLEGVGGRGAVVSRPVFEWRPRGWL